MLVSLYVVINKLCLANQIFVRYSLLFFLGFVYALHIIDNDIKCRKIHFITFDRFLDIAGLHESNRETETRTDYYRCGENERVIRTISTDFRLNLDISENVKLRRNENY